MSNLISILEKNYTIEKEIGRGGMGTVYLAMDKRLERKVAIKILSLASTNEEQISIDELILRFQREANSIAKLAHKNIVSIYDIGEDDNKYFMVMEFLEGKSLSDLLREKIRFPPLLAVSIGIQICNALDFAHENGIIHRDVKPANIILSGKGIAKLTDFGIAQFNKEQIKITQDGALLGSIMYIPPEQLENSASVDHRVDIYSLGITLYEIISGVLPFESDTVSQLFFKILSEKPKKLSTYYPDIPEVMDQIIEKALFKNAFGRYQSAKEMANDLLKVFDPELLTNENISTFFTDNEVWKTNEIVSEKKSSKISNTDIRKTIIDKTITRILKNNYSWVKTLIQDWQSEQITGLNIDELMDRLMLPSEYAIAYTGALIIDENIYVFVYDGNFVGAIDINNDIRGENVFQSLPNNPGSLEFKIPEGPMIFSPVIISSIIDASGEIVHKNLDSSSVHLLNIVNNLFSEEEPFSGYVSCYTVNNTYYYGFYRGLQIFAVPLNKTDDDTYSDLKNLVASQGVIFNAYQLKPVLAGPTIINLLKKSIIYLKYKQDNQANLNNIIEFGDKIIPVQIINDAKNNIELIFNSQQEETINILDQEINLTKILKNTIYYHFAGWVLNEYFFLIYSSGNINCLKYLYTWIAAIEYIRFFENLPGDDGNNIQFTMVFHGELINEDFEKVLFVTRFGNGSIEDVDKFIDDTIQVKKNLSKSGDIGGAIYVSTEEYSQGCLNLFYERTLDHKKGFGIGSLDKLNKYKGFVKIGFGKGFHLNLLEYKSENNSFNVIAPILK